MGMKSANASWPNGGSRKATSNGLPWAAPAVRRKRDAPISTTWAFMVPPRRSSSLTSDRAAACACSTNTKAVAPRDKASRPNAPEPAKRSKQCAPTMESCSQLNRVSRTRSGVGRRPGRSGKWTRRPRHPPAMIRTEFRPSAPGLTGFVGDTGGIIPSSGTMLAGASRVAGCSVNISHP